MNVLRASLVGVLAAVLFGAAFASASAGKPLPAHIDGWRPWDDLAIASAYVRDGAFPVAPYGIGNSHRRRSPEFRAFRQPIMKVFRERPVTDAWVSVDTDRLVAQRAFPVTRVDDSGRAFFLALLFRWTGAVRPLFIVWMPIVFVAAMLGWAAFELALQGHTLGALVFASLVSLSSFLRDGAAIGYAAYGFYFAAGLALIAFSIAMSSRDVAMRALPRLAIACAALSVAVPARSAAFLMVPAFGLVWMARFWPSAMSRSRPWLLVFGLVCLVAAPRASLKAIDVYSVSTMEATNRKDWPTPGVGGHDAWPTLWAGFGDFDRTKGHQYTDDAAKKLALVGGVRDRIDGSAEVFFRDIIVWEIARDPLWLMEILVRRMHATFFLDKLAPTAAASGSSYSPSTHPNEGAFDSYMTLLPTADQFGWGRSTAETPSTLLWLGWPVLFALRLAKGWPVGGEVRAMRVLGFSLVALMASPVIVTTASAVEMQTVVMAHLLAWALALDLAFRRMASHRSLKTTPV